MKPCNALSTHYSAFVDGELTPLESVAIRKHLLRCSQCRQEVQELENMKLVVHLHGGVSPARPDIRMKLEQSLNRLERRRTRQVQGGFLAVATVLAIIVVIGSPTQSVSLPVTPDESVEVSPSTPPTVEISAKRESIASAKILDDTIFGELVRHHQGLSSVPLAHPRGVLSFEALPVRFLEGNTQVKQVLNASYQRCLQTHSGASLAILDATALKLPPQVEASLDRIGVYVEQRDTVEMRVSQSGQRFFVLLTDKANRLDSAI